eukprot:3734729-Pleurochrysis_carterae.AAC.1
MICRTCLNSRSKAARGPSWSFRPTQLNHARLSWRVLPNLILYSGSLPELSSGRQEPTIN